MSIVAPITADQQQQVITRVDDLLLQCERKFNQSFQSIDVRFDLTGRTSGMYVVRHRLQYFRFNGYIFAKYFEDGLATTVPHEVAHYVSDVLFGIRNIRPHGKEWQSIMHALGVEPTVTGDYDLTGVPTKRQRRFDYACGCMTHRLSTTRHNKVLAGKACYCCQKCGATLKKKTVLELI